MASVRMNEYRRECEREQYEKDSENVILILGCREHTLPDTNMFERIHLAERRHARYGTAGHRAIGFHGHVSRDCAKVRSEEKEGKQYAQKSSCISALSEIHIFIIAS